MALIIQKFGGTSVGSLERIKNVVNIVNKELKKGNQVIVVSSAIAGVTDELITLTKQVSSLTSKEQLAEYDSIISTGEQVACGLISLALNESGIKARSYSAWQIPINVNEAFTNSRILNIEANHLNACLKAQIVPVITGFQGVYNNQIATLGRGGSDTTAVAIAVILKADRCDIYTDVNGVYTADPKIVHKARKLKQISYEEMLEMASLGAKVLHSRCVEIAMKYNLKMRVLSSFDEEEGTMVTNETQILEKQIITGVTCKKDIASITIKALNDSAGSISQIFNTLKKKEINVDLIVQNIGSRGKTDLTFTVQKQYLNNTLDAIKPKEKILYRELYVDDNIAEVSIIGIGIKTNPSVAQKMFQILAEKGISILVISTSEIKISVLIQAEYQELAMRALHIGYQLDL